jgi:predicted nucleotidyltransferase
VSTKADLLRWLTTVAQKLGDVREKVAFVGGATVFMLITDSASASVRPTKDIDIIVKIRTWAEYAPFLESLRQKGFREDCDEDSPLCRWTIDGLKIDVMPTDAGILGFTNRWYERALEKAVSIYLNEDLPIRVVTAPYFLATKLEAFKSRGGGDFQLSHDIEDIIALIDGRSELIEETGSEDADLRRYLSAEVGQLLADRHFVGAIPGHLPGDEASQYRLPEIINKLVKISSLG